MNLENFQFKISSMNSVLPYRLTKRIAKTKEGRSGAEIYKRRNRRSYRGLMQYVTWKNLVDGKLNPNILLEYKEGFLVWISPDEYFSANGTNTYPEKNPGVDKDFKLGGNGFVYYTSPDEYDRYPILKDWNELRELSTKPSDFFARTWVGEYCLNIRNGNPQRISNICADSNSQINTEELRKEVGKILGIQIPEEIELPKQSGIGNYDFDYANEEMMENVEMQMLFLALVCEDENGYKFRDYIKNNYDKIKDPKDTSIFVKNVNSESYNEKFDAFFSDLKKACQINGLLDYSKLAKINAWDLKLNRPICPLCSKPLTADMFFAEIEQMEGRQVASNTQRAIVLMHISALRPGYLNHRIYNLGWGDNFCNAIQGDKDITETIKMLDEIVITYKEHTK